MKIKNSLAIPIIILLVGVACSTLYVGYYINIHSLHDALEAREKSKAEGVYFIINSLIKEEINHLSKLSKLVSNNHELSEALDFYYKSDLDSRPLVEVMQQLYSQLGTDIFLVTDVRGVVLYRANAPAERGDVHMVWGMDEALAGQALVAAALGPRGMAIRALAPIYYADELRGVLIIGTRLGDKFAQKIAAATNTNVSFGIGNQLVASSLPLPQQGLINPADMSRSIEEKTTLFQVDHDNHLMSFMYAPLQVEDEMLCLVINSDATEISRLLSQQQRQLYTSFLPIFLAVVGLGSGLTWYIIRPLNRLQKQAVSAIREFHGEDVAVAGAWQ